MVGVDDQKFNGYACMLLQLEVGGSENFTTRTVEHHVETRHKTTIPYPMYDSAHALRGARVFADADEIITFWSVYQRTYVEVLVLVIPSAPQTVTSTFPFESA